MIFGAHFFGEIQEKLVEYMGGSINGATPKSSILNRIFPYKPAIFRDPNGNTHMKTVEPNSSFTLEVEAKLDD